MDFHVYGLKMKLCQRLRLRHSSSYVEFFSLGPDSKMYKMPTVRGCTAEKADLGGGGQGAQ